MPQFLTAAQLAKMRADVLRMLPDTATLQIKTLATGGDGTWSETWATQSSVACRVDPINPRNSSTDITAMRETVPILYQLTVPYDATISLNHRVVTGGKTYEIRQLYAEHSSNVSRRAVIARIE